MKKRDEQVDIVPDRVNGDETISSHGPPDSDRRDSTPVDDGHFASGSSFGRFQIIRVLGRGGMGIVYLAFDPKMDRQVALKVMRSDVARHQRERYRFIREARAAAKITSDHVVVVYEADEIDGLPYIAQQFLAGCTLDEYLKSQPAITDSLIVRFAKDICEGLRVAHASGLVHRDIKPSNLWVESPNQRIKILDFGLAYVQQSEETLTMQGTVLGTPAFMSPEQALGKEVDPTSDLFSVGVVLYQLCSGQLPFKGDSAVAILHSILHDQPESVHALNPTIGISLSNVIGKLLAKDRQQRYSSASEVLEALQGLESGEAAIVVEAPSPSLKPNRRWVRSIIAIGLAAIAIGIIGTAFLSKAPMNWKSTNRDDLPEFRGARARLASLEQNVNKTPNRVSIKYEVEIDGGPVSVNPPFLIGVFANLSGQTPLKELTQRKFVQIDRDNFDDVISAMKPTLVLNVPDRLDEKGSQTIELAFHSIDDFGPLAVAQQIPEIARLIQIRRDANSQVNPSTSRIEAIDARISSQLREIFHHPDFRRLESTWRGLQLLIGRSPTSEQLQIRVLNVKKNELIDDILLANDSKDNKLFKVVYENEYGMPGGTPYALLVGDFEIGSDTDEIYLLSLLGKVAALSGAPMVLPVSPSFFGVSNFKTLQTLPFDSLDLGSDWQRFRESPEAKYVGLTLPRFVARLPYSPKANTQEFNFYEPRSEDTKTEDITWISGVWLFAANVAMTVDEYGWPARISGERGGGKFDWLPEYGISSQSKKSMDGLFGQTQQLSLIQNGFMPFDPGKESEPTMLLSTQSCAKNSKFNELMCAASFVRALKMISRDKIGSFFEIEDMNLWLNHWLDQYCLADPANATEEERIRRPLLEASADVRPVPGESGTRTVHLKVRPHYQFDPLPKESMEFNVSVPSGMQ